MKVTINYEKANTNKTFNEVFEEFLEYYTPTGEVEELRKVG